MKIKNIANDRDRGGYYYSSEKYHPITNHLQMQPWVGGVQIFFDEEHTLPDEVYFRDPTLMDELKAHRILDFIVPEKKEVIVEPAVVKVKATEKVIDIEEPSALATEEKSDVEVVDTEEDVTEKVEVEEVKTKKKGKK